ncbi:MAG: hypothetical protein M1823_008871, partial [Watsoniomyces obsoletus]
MEKYEQWLKDAPAREKASKSADQKKGKTVKGAEGREANESEKDGMGSKADRSQAGDSMKDPFYETFDPEAPLDQFSFANIKKGDKPLLDEYVKRFSWV